MRDTTAPESAIRAAVAGSEEAVRRQLSAGTVDPGVIGDSLSIVLGRYTLGEKPAVCLEPAVRVVEALCGWLKRSGGEIGWKLQAQGYNELVAAAVLADRADRLFSALADARWKTPSAQWERDDLDRVSRAFGGRAPAWERPPEKFPKAPRWLPTLLPMLESMIEPSGSAFEPAFLAYVTKGWGPAVEQNARALLAAHAPLYTGKWSLLAAASCRKMGVVPDLPKKAEQFFPRELV